MERLLTLSLRYRFFTLVTLLLVISAGLYSLRELPIDAVPDLTPVQVQILTRAPALGPVEVEQFVTFPIETNLSGLPGLKEIRSISRYGISVVTAIFEDHLDLYFARQLVNERLTLAVDQIPPQYARPLIGPLTTGLGEVYQFTLSGQGYSPMELRTLLEWDIGRRLRSIPGVVEVNIWGGEEKQFQVIVDPQKLLAFKLSPNNVYEALERNNALAGGGYIVHEREQFLIRGEAMAQGVTDLGQILVDHAPGGIPIYVQDVAVVQEGANLRIGAATRMGEGETVIGMVQMLAGANAQHVGGTSQISRRRYSILFTGRRRDRTILRSFHLRFSSDPYRSKQSSGRRLTRCSHFIFIPGPVSIWADRGHGHSLIHARSLYRHVENRHLRKSHEPWRDRFWPVGGWVGGDDR